MLPLPSPQSKPQNPAAAPRFPRQVPETACPGGGGGLLSPSGPTAGPGAEPRRAGPCPPCRRGALSSPRLGSELRGGARAARSRSAASPGRCGLGHGAGRRRRVGSKGAGGSVGGAPSTCRAPPGADREAAPVPPPCLCARPAAAACLGLRPA